MSGSTHRAAAATWAVLLAVATGAGSCDRGSNEVAEAGRFTRGDVRAIVLGPEDAPEGTEYVRSVSGFQQIAQFARDPTEFDRLRDDRFLVGHLALFVPIGAGDPAALTEPLEADAIFVQGITGLFEGPDGADSALRRFVADLHDRQLPDATDVSAEGLGDAAFGLGGTARNGARVMIYAWRSDNIVLAVSGSGDIAGEDVRALADLLDDRTAVTGASG